MTYAVIVVGGVNKFLLGIRIVPEPSAMCCDGAVVGERGSVSPMPVRTMRDGMAGQ
jgi:hypothetical protein